MTSEQTITDVQPASEVTIADVLAEVKKVQETQTRLHNRQGWLERQIDRIPAGQSVPPALQAELAEVHTLLTDMQAERIEAMDDEQKAAHYQKLAETATKKAQAAGRAVRYSDTELAVVLDDYFAGPLISIIEQYCQAGGIELTDEMRTHLDTKIPLTINPYTKDVNPTSYLKAAYPYLDEQGKAQREKAAALTPAEQAGKVLGNGTGPGGGAGRKAIPNWLDPALSFEEMWEYGKKP